MKKFFRSPAIILNIVLILSVILLAGLSVAVVIFAQSKLAAYVADTDHLKIDSELNEQDIETGKRLEQILDANKDNIAKAADVVADTQAYKYQDQIVKDVKKYADASNITVLGFNFVDSNSTKKNPTGLKSLNAIITLNNPISYTDFLRFLRLLEANLTKLQVAQIDVQANTDKRGLIDSQTITLEVYGDAK